MKRDSYRDLIKLPHHVSPVHKQMSMRKRAAQFASFAALRGYEEKVAETARRTLTRPLLSEDRQEELRQRMNAALAMEASPHVRITRFEADPYKDGGALKTAIGRLKRYDSIKGIFLLQDGTSIPVAEIVDFSVIEMPQENAHGINKG